MEPEKEKLDLAKAKLDLEKVRCQVALEELGGHTWTHVSCSGLESGNIGCDVSSACCNPRFSAAKWSDPPWQHGPSGAYERKERLFQGVIGRGVVVFFGSREGGAAAASCRGQFELGALSNENYGSSRADQTGGATAQ